MLNYKTALALKEAGFPQEIKHGYVHSGPPTAIKEPCPEAAYVPTLSELIEACGSSLTLVVTPGGSCVASNEETPMLMHHGVTPTEAVANLWLETHGKKAS